MAPSLAGHLEVGASIEATRVDAFGPSGVKNGGRVTRKKWAVLCTCPKVRATLFEVLKDLSAPTFLCMLVHLRTRSQGVRQLYSDCCTNFKGAELRRTPEVRNSSPTKVSLSCSVWSGFLSFPMQVIRQGSGNA